MSVVENKLKEIGVSSEVSYLFPKLCTYCDLDLGLSSDLTVLKCPNPFCRGLYYQRAVTFCEVLGLTQFSYSFFERLVTEFGWKSEFISEFYNLDKLLVDISDNEFRSRFEVFKSELQKVKESLTLEQYLTSLALPMVEDIIPTLCERYDTLDEFYSELDIVLDFDGYLTIFGLSIGSEDLILRYLEIFNIYRRDLLGYKL
jgi:NAD-dependent DNA ligase